MGQELYGRVAGGAIVTLECALEQAQHAVYEQLPDLLRCKGPAAFKKIEGKCCKRSEMKACLQLGVDDGNKGGEDGGVIERAGLRLHDALAEDASATHQILRSPSTFPLATSIDVV